MKRNLFLSLLLSLALFSGCAMNFNGVGQSNADSGVNASTASSSNGSDLSIEDGLDSSNGGSDIDTDGHTDTNDDGLCDDCNQNVTVTFDFFAVNDLHGKFADSDTQPGVDELSTYLKQARAQNENTVVLSSGDMWQGSSESNLTKGLIVTEWMNEMDFSSMTLGNHEYDWGSEYIRNNLAIAEFPFLALNIFYTETDEPVEYCQPSVTVEKNGVKIGIIGAIGDCYSSISGDKVKDVYFKTGDELTELVKAESEKLRGEGADFIVYSIHDGYGSSLSGVGNISDYELLPYYDIELSEGYVDLVFEGHTHQSYVLKDSKGVYHLQDGGDNDGVSHAEIKINFANDSGKVLEAEFVDTNDYAQLPDDPVVEELMSKYEEQIAIAGKVLGKNDRFRDGDELRQIVAELYYEAAIERWGEEYDIVLGGGYMSVRSPYDLEAGTVTYGDLQSIFPFDNPLVLCSIPGYALRSQFFETSNRNYFISYGDYGASVKNNIDDNATYYIVIDTYSSQYAPNRATEIERYDDTTYARDLLAKYIEDGGMSATKEEIVLSSIPEILEIGGALEANTVTSELYCVKGRITEIKSETWGNMYLTDENGNVLYVYGTYDEYGSTRYDSLADKPQVGDTVVIKGVIKKYVTATGEEIIEIINGRLIPAITEPIEG